MKDYIGSCIFTLIVVALGFLMFGIISTSYSDRGKNDCITYSVVYEDGRGDTLEYPHCEVYSDGGLFHGPSGIYISCGEWTSNDPWTATFQVTYKAKIVEYKTAEDVSCNR